MIQGCCWEEVRHLVRACREKAGSISEEAALREAMPDGGGEAGDDFD